MKSILYLLACDIDYTGTPLFVRDLIDNLNSGKYDVSVYSPGMIRNNVYTNVQVYEGGIQLNDKITREFRIWNNLKTIFGNRNFDVIHINTSNVHIAYLYVLFFYKYSKKIICHSHNVILYKDNLIYRKCIGFKRKTIVNKSDALFACSSEAGEAMFGKSSSFTLVNNFIDPVKFRFDKSLRDNLRKKIGHPIVLGNIGAFNGQKNQTFLLELMKQLDERFALVLVGNGKQKEDCIKYCKANHLDNVLFFDGTANVQQFYSAFDIFLLPSHFEGFGRVILEAFISNLDIITSDYIPIAYKFGLTHLPLECDKWKESILKKAERLNTRRDNIEVVKQYGYDVNSVVNLVESYYD